MNVGLKMRLLISIICFADQEMKSTILKRLVSIQSDISDDIKEVIKRQQSRTQSESKSRTHSESDQGHTSRKSKSRTHSESEQKSDSESPYKNLVRRQRSRQEHSDADHSDHLKVTRQLSYKSGSETEYSPSKRDRLKSISKSMDISRQASKVDGPLETDPSAQLIEEEELEMGRVSKYFVLFLAHMSHQAHKVSLLYTHALVSVCCHPSFSKISETAWPIKAKFHDEPPWEGGTKVYINGPGHMTRMATMPIYG